MDSLWAGIAAVAAAVVLFAGIGFGRPLFAWWRYKATMAAAARAGEAGRFDEAERILRAAAGRSGSNVRGPYLSSLGHLLLQAGKHAEAEEACEEAIAFLQKAGAPAELQLVPNDTLAAIYAKQGRAEEAERLCRRLLARRESRHGPDHEELYDSLNLLGSLLSEQDRLEESIAVTRRALAIAEQRLGPDHPAAHDALGALGRRLLRAGAQDEAMACLQRQRALASTERAAGSSHPATAEVLTMVAAGLRARGKDAEAAPLLERALGIFEKAVGPEHPAVASCATELAAALDHLGDWTRAAQLFERAVAIHRKVHGPESAQTASALTNLAMLLRRQDQLLKAREAFEEAQGFLARAGEIQAARPKVRLDLL